MSTSLLRTQHSALQFSDIPKQQESDIRDLYERGRAFPVKTFTEAGIDAAGKNKNREFLQKFSEEFDHVLHFKGPNAISVDRKIIVPRTIEKDSVFVIDNDELVGNMHDRVFPTLAFEHIDENIGQVAFAAAHYARRGARPGDPNYDANRLYSAKIAGWMRDAGRGRGLAFVNGDFNMNDRSLDWAFGRKFTSMADELKAWQNTGHGPIDGFASYDRDGRVKAKSFNVLDDKEFPQFSDHYVCRGVWEIKSAKR